MRAQQIYDALGVMRDLRHGLVDKQRFKGYSGPVRALCGSGALVSAALMATPWYPETAFAHLIGWGTVFLAASLLNAGALLYWFLNDDMIHRDWRRLRPTLDVIPPLAVGALLTFVFLLNRDFQYLFGCWMCMFGLTNLASRYVLPGQISLVGVFYVVCGAAFLAAPPEVTLLRFTNPWPMGLVFFVGEWAGGLVLYFDRRRYTAFANLLQHSSLPEETKAHDD